MDENGEEKCGVVYKWKIGGDRADGVGSWTAILNLFFFQAEDGIRDHCVTGVQTCALPICNDTVCSVKFFFSKKGNNLTGTTELK